MKRKLLLFLFSAILLVPFSGCGIHQVLFQLPEYTNHDFESPSESEKYILKQSGTKFILTDTFSKKDVVFEYSEGIPLNKGLEITGIYDKNVKVRKDRFTNGLNNKSYIAQGSIESKRLFNFLDVTEQPGLLVRIFDTGDQKEIGSLIMEDEPLTRFVGEINGEKITIIDSEFFEGRGERVLTEKGKVWHLYPGGRIITISDQHGTAAKIIKGMNAGKLLGMQIYHGLYCEIYFKKDLNNDYKSDILSTFLISEHFSNFEMETDKK